MIRGKKGYHPIIFSTFWPVQISTLLAVCLHAANPFDHCAAGVISKADEVKRDRILTPDEEKNLLDACIEERAHLKAILLVALDCGLRRGEILSLRKSDVDLDSRVINLKALNTKTIKPRSVPISERVAFELAPLIEKLDDSSLLFPFKDIKHSFSTACRLAGIKNFHLHDCRHHCASKLISAGMPLEEVCKILGHTQTSTLFQIYYNITNATLDKARRILNQEKGVKDE
jgi:integrase